MDAGSKWGEARRDLYEAVLDLLPDSKRALYRLKDFLSGARSSPLLDAAAGPMLNTLSEIAEGFFGCLEQLEGHIGEELRILRNVDRLDYSVQELLESEAREDRSGGMNAYPDETDGPL